MRSYLVTFTNAGDICTVDQPARSAIDAVRVINRAYGHIADCDNPACACQSRTYEVIDAGRPVQSAPARHAGAINYRVTIDGTTHTYTARYYRVTEIGR